LLKELGVVAEHGDAAHEGEYGVLICGLSVLLDLALRRITVASDLIRGLGGDGRHHHHLHQSKSARFVRADPRYRTERLNCGQTPNYRVALCHALDADCQRDRDERRQPFRDDRYSDADDRLKQLDEVHALHPFSVGEDQHADHRDGCGDDVAERLDLAQERSLERTDTGEQLIDTAELGIATGRHNDTSGSP
jgi:hypothetical protein